METEKLMEIRKNLALLPALQRKIKDLRSEIRRSEETVNGLKEKYRRESLDVERLERDSFSTLLLKNFGRYEDRLSRESEEMLAAKLEYDKAAERLGSLNEEEKELEGRISELKREALAYEAELKDRKEAIKSKTGSEVNKKYEELEAEQDTLAKQLAETEEALRAAEAVISTAGDAMEHLRSAEGWATFDMWTRGGIFSHMAKYEHIDNAKYCFNRLNSQLKNLQRELGDLNMAGISSLDGIDSTTRAIDFWFDNIFTDLNVRSRIRNDNERVSELYGKTRALARRLESDKAALRSRITELEQKKNELAIGLRKEP